MTQSEMKNAPPLYGWAIAAGMGLVAFAVSLLLVGIEGNGSVAIGAVVALVVGIIFTVAESSAPPAKAAGTAPTVSSGAGAARVATPATPAPIPAAATTTTSTSAVAPAATEPKTPQSVAAQPEPAASTAPDDVVGTQPSALASPVGEADDLKRISGVGPVLEGKLNGLGIYHFWQIARWNADEVTWVDGFLNFKGRIDRDDWIEQAKTLAADSPSRPPA